MGVVVRRGLGLVDVAVGINIFPRHLHQSPWLATVALNAAVISEVIRLFYLT